MTLIEIIDNIKRVKDDICNAAVKSGRKPEDIRLIAVTKTVDPQRINIALENGITDIGENRVQELLQKYDEVHGDVFWHLIGQLQTNKVKYIINKVKLIHSLDRLSLAQEIQKQCQKTGKIMPVLVEVNIGKEQTKAGIMENDLENFIKEIAAFPNIAVQGLMTVAPLVQDKEKVRPYFQRMRIWFERLKESGIPGVKMKYLSMGMSNDFQIAIEEGSNMIRVGTAIFGKRQPK